MLLAAGAAWLLPAAPALAEEVGTSYNAAAQSELLTNVAGLLYVCLLVYFLVRVFSRRSKSFSSESLTSGARAQREGGGKVTEEVDPEVAQVVSVTPTKTLLFGVQALAVSAALLFVAVQVQGLLERQGVPDQYTARNITVTVRTILSGLIYLASFIFGANGVGLTLLAGKLLIFGDDEAVPAAERAAMKPKALPKINLTSDIEDVLQAFDDAAKPSQYSKRAGADDAKR